MSPPFYAYRWASILLEFVPESTESLFLYDVPCNSEVYDLITAVPQLTRLTLVAYPRLKIDLDVFFKYGNSFEALPQLKYLDLRRCGLKDKGLMRILLGCRSRELLELKLSHNKLKFEEPYLNFLLSQFTKLQ